MNPIDEQGRKLSERIITFRRHRRMTQREFGEILGVSGNTISRVELTATGIKKSTLDKIESALKNYESNCAGHVTSDNLPTAPTETAEDDGGHIPIHEAIFINQEGWVDPEQIHAYLNVPTPFAIWIRRRIEQYKFQVNQDFKVYYENEINSPSQGGRPKLRYSVDRFMAFTLLVVDKADLATEARRYLLASHDFAVAKISAPQETSQIELFKTVIEMNREMIREMTGAIAKIGSSFATPDKVHDLIDERFTEETINKQPDGTKTRTEMRAEIFCGISEDKIGAWLRHRNHPRKLMKVMKEFGETHESWVFISEGLEAEYERLLAESKYIKDTPMYHKMYHPVIGNYYIEKGCRYRPLQVVKTEKREGQDASHDLQ